MAVWNGDHADVVRALLDAGADPRVTNHNWQTPLELARYFDKLESASAAADVFDIAEWRERWAKPAAGRARAIALLEAAMGEGADEKMKEDAGGAASKHDGAEGAGAAMDVSAGGAAEADAPAPAEE
jgi:hypothetical protein